VLVKLIRFDRWYRHDESHLQISVGQLASQLIQPHFEVPIVRKRVQGTF